MQGGVVKEAALLGTQVKNFPVCKVNMADFTEPIPVERLQTGPLSSSLMDSSSCDPGGSAAGSLMDSARRCSYGLPGASWALASVGGALLQQVVALRPKRRGLESYQTSRGVQAWGKHHLPNQASLCKVPMVLGTPASAVASCAQTHALSRCCPSASSLLLRQAGQG